MASSLQESAALAPATANHGALVNEELGQELDRLLQDARELLAQRKLPTSTYRLQFRREFTFRDAIDVIPYLAELGISHIYASPYLKARPGSPHGYDIVDHGRLNPEIGTEADFEEFVGTLRRHGMGHILDVVPNHMNVSCDENEWWWDVLENGPSSSYAGFFDVDWHPIKPELAGKVLLPVLGDQFGKVLEEQQLQLQFADGRFVVRYFERGFPLAPRSTLRILQHGLEELEQRLGADNRELMELQSILTAIRNLPTRDETAPEKVAERNREKEIIRERLRKLVEASPEVAAFITENVNMFNGHQGDSRSFDQLDELLQDQAYRLCYWRVAADEINYRRFFDINELAAVCMENPNVFEQTHARVLEWLAAGKLDGLRIDHADGLHDPAGYLWKLQESRFVQLCRQAYDARPMLTPWELVEPELRTRFQALAAEPGHPLLRSLYVVVEKILERTERVPEDWPVHGTTGYDFLNDLNRVFVEARGAKPFDALYQRFLGDKLDFEELVYQSKRLIMVVSMSSELNVLGHHLDQISENDRWSRDFTLVGLTRALREVVACFPVYRTYITERGMHDQDREYIEQAVRRAKRRNAAVSAAVFDFIRDTLSLEAIEPHDIHRLARQESRLRFIGRFQQFTGPLMAKAVEDTTFYIYNRLASLNEVGGDPQKFGGSVEAFHEQNRERRAVRPYALLATSTHDTKRSEDVRARINVLSELPKDWKLRIVRWARWNQRKKVRVDNQDAPSRNDEYLLYQTLLGTWPFATPRGPELQTYIERIQDYMIKAVREAKAHTSWIAPYEPYEAALREFISAILKEKPTSAFRTDFEPFAQRVAVFGIWNGLSQTLLKLASPGIPDIYQGTELWDFSLVDPDNRRPVDYAARRQALSQMAERLSRGGDNRRDLVRDLLEHAQDGRLKLYLTAELLRLRRLHPQLFTEGEYHPVGVSGERADRVVAFVRRHESHAVLIVAPRLLASYEELGDRPPVGSFWAATRLDLPAELAELLVPDRGRHVLSGQPLASSGSPGSLADLFADLPLAVVLWEPPA